MEARPPAEEMFEQLLVLRRCYPMRSEYDRTPTLRVEAAIDYAEWRMRLTRISELRHGPWQVRSA